jgi:hypothetical protein
MTQTSPSPFEELEKGRTVSPELADKFLSLPTMTSLPESKQVVQSVEKLLEQN